MARDRRLHRLADPPDRVRNKLHAAIRIELPGGGHQTQIALADQVDEWYATILELLGDRHDEADVVTSQALLRHDAPLERLPREFHFLLAVEQRDATDLVEIQVKTLATLVDRARDLRRTNGPALLLRRQLFFHSDQPPWTRVVPADPGTASLQNQRRFSAAVKITAKLRKINTLRNLMPYCHLGGSPCVGAPRLPQTCQICRSATLAEGMQDLPLRHRKVDGRRRAGRADMHAGVRLGQTAFISLTRRDRVAFASP